MFSKSIGLMSFAALAALSISTTAMAQDDIEARNKEIAQKFYDDLWFSQNTDRYADYVAESYIVHDTGDRKNVTESAIEQKQIADFFWSIGTLDGEMDYQVAESDMVVNRWTLTFTPNDKGEAMGMFAVEDIPIINVFRFNDDGKIVEIWNHRHDVDLPRPEGPPPAE